MKEVYASAGGVTDIISMDVTASAGCATFSFQTPSNSFSVGDAISLEMGYTGNIATMLTGYVDTVIAERPPGLYRIEGRDKLKLAADYFIAVASLDKADWFNPRLETGATSPGDVIGDILTLCGLGGLSGGAPAGWEIGNATDGTPFQLMSALDAIQQVCAICACRVWCDSSGAIQMASVLDSSGTGGAFTTGDSGNILSCSYSKSDTDLRNKVVVIGAIDDDGYYSATASTPSPYLPDGYYKTAVISTDLISSTAAAEATASANLTALNKLTESTTVDALGTPGLECYNSVTVTESFTGAPGGTVQSVTHTIDGSGYRTQFTAKVI